MDENGSGPETSFLKTIKGHVPLNQVFGRKGTKLLYDFSGPK